MQINPRILLVMLAAALTSCGPGAAPMTVEQVPPPRPAIAGITVDSIEQLDAVAAAVDKLSAEVTVRLVFDPRMDPGYYATAVDLLGEHANLMGELLDSEAMTLLDVDGVRERANAYLTAFSDKIAIWEIGNELNGKWVGDSPAEIDAKALAAFEVVKQHGGSTAITLNYWSSPDCYDHPWEQTVPFAQQLPDKLKSEVDYLLLSVYETACDPPQQPSAGSGRHLDRAGTNLSPGLSRHRRDRCAGQSGWPEDQGPDHGGASADRRALPGYAPGVAVSGGQPVRGRLLLVVFLPGRRALRPARQSVANPGQAAHRVAALTPAGGAANRIVRVFPEWRTGGCAARAADPSPAYGAMMARAARRIGKWSSCDRRT